MQTPVLSFVILFLAVLNFTLAVDKKEIMAQCMQQYSITEEMFNYYKQNGQAQDENSTDQKCSILCVMSKLGMADEKGNLDVPKLKESMIQKYDKMSPENVVAMVDKCAARSETDPCEKVYRFHSCTLKSYIEFVKG